MKFISSRGKHVSSSFEEALFKGRPEDRGLYMPERIPDIPLSQLQRWENIPYVELCKNILPLFIDSEEIPRKALECLIEKAFETSYDDLKIVPLISHESYKIAELWHGKSLAFKDLGNGILANLFTYFLEKRKRHINVMVVTSGDTGSSAIESVRGNPLIDIFVMFPLNRCSDIQERQMTTVTDSNVHVFGMDGTSDDFDEVMGKCFNDQKFAESSQLTTMNSASIARILVQIVHYFYIYLNSGITVGDTLSIVVPCGGLGNMTGGCIAKAMGLPINLVAAVNINGTTAKVINTGIMEIPQNVFCTSSVSMDISVPSNFERLFYVYSGENTEAVRNIMDEFTKTGKVSLPSELKENLQKNLAAALVSEEVVDEVIKTVWEQHRYHLEPHTAVGMAVIMFRERYGVLNPDNPVVCISTASPAKFPETFHRLGIPYELPLKQQELLQKTTKYTKLTKDDNWVQIIKDAVLATC